MKGNLIKINNDFVLVTELNGEPKEGQLFLTNENVIHSNIGYNYGDRLITHSTNDNHNVGKLSFKNCQEIEIGYDLEELSENVYREYPTESKNSGFEYNRDRHVFKKRKAFIKGFEKCLEILGEKKFSVKDMEKLMFATIEFTEQKEGETYPFLKSFIQSLQPKEWDVEICCYVDSPSGWLDADSFNSPLLTNIGEPKLDSNDCLILK
jgi:hypothetical protein